jgi:hypothetical protein
MWGKDNKEEKPPEVKPPEQTKEQADDLVTRLSASFEATIKPLRDKVDSYETRFSTIEQATRKPEPKVENQELPDFYDNPDAAFNARALPQNVAIVQLTARFTEQEVLGDLERNGWSAYVPKIRKELDENTPIAVKGDPNYGRYVRNVARMVIGDAAMEKGLKFDAGKQTFFLEDSSSNTSNPSENAKNNKLMELASDGKISLFKGERPEDAVEFLQKKLGIKDVDKFLKTVTS